MFSEKPETRGGWAINYVVYFADFAAVARFFLEDWEEINVWLRLEWVYEVVWKAFLALFSVVSELVHCHVLRHGFDFLLQLTAITFLQYFLNLDNLANQPSFFLCIRIKLIFLAHHYRFIIHNGQKPIHNMQWAFKATKFLNVGVRCIIIFYCFYQVLL